MGDGPQSGAREVIKLDKRVFYGEHGPTNAWGNAQRDFGISHAKGAFLTFVDDDDIIAPGSLAKIRPLLTPNFHFFRILGLYRPIPAAPRFGAGCLIPNDPAKLGQWRLKPGFSDGCNCECEHQFLGETMAHYPNAQVHDITLYICRPNTTWFQNFLLRTRGLPASYANKILRLIWEGRYDDANTVLDTGVISADGVKPPAYFGGW